MICQHCHHVLEERRDEEDGYTFTVHQTVEQAKACRKIVLEKQIGKIDLIRATFDATCKCEAIEHTGPETPEHLFHSVFLFDDEEHDLPRKIKDCVAEFASRISACTRRMEYKDLPEIPRESGAMGVVIYGNIPFRVIIQYDMRGAFTGRFHYEDDGRPKMVEVKDDDGEFLCWEHSREYKSGHRITVDALVNRFGQF